MNEKTFDVNDPIIPFTGKWINAECSLPDDPTVHVFLVCADIEFSNGEELKTVGLAGFLPEEEDSMLIQDGWFLLQPPATLSMKKWKIRYWSYMPSAPEAIALFNQLQKEE